MDRFKRSTALLLITQLILLTSGQNLTATLSFLEPFGDPDFIHITCTPSIIKDYKSTPNPVCDVELRDTVTCDMTVHWRLFGIDKDGKEFLVQEDTDTLENCLVKAKGSIMYSMVDNLRKCLKIPNLCPIAEATRTEKCKFDTGVTAIPISNQFLAELTFIRDGEEKCGLRTKIDIDDKNLAVRKRPTSGQKQKRRQKN